MTNQLINIEKQLARIDEMEAQQVEQQKAVIRMHLRTAFLTTESGRYAGRWLLNHLKLIGRLETDADVARHNAASEFLEAGRFELTDFIEGATNDRRSQ